MMSLDIVTGITVVKVTIVPLMVVWAINVVRVVRNVKQILQKIHQKNVTAMNVKHVWKALACQLQQEQLVLVAAYAMVLAVVVQKIKARTIVKKNVNN